MTWYPLNVEKYCDFLINNEGEIINLFGLSLDITKKIQRQRTRNKKSSDIVFTNPQEAIDRCNAKTLQLDNETSLQLELM